MKKILLVAAAFAMALGVSAEDYNYMTIKQADKTVSIPLENVQSVTFTTDDQTTAEADYTLRVLTFEDADYKGDGNYLGNKDWSSLIDSPQYGGSLLYNDYSSTDYQWSDDNNTMLCAAIDPNDQGYVYWSGGEAISNYVNANYATEEVPYTQQLEAPSVYAGSNFCMHFGYFEEGVTYNSSPVGGMWFSDNTARVIDHMYVCLSSYSLSSIILGNSFCPAATDTDWLKIIAIGTDAQGNTTQTEISMMENGVVKTDWQKFDLSVLGEIVRLDFNITSSMSGSYGLNVPGYFAYDNVAVRFPKE